MMAVIKTLFVAILITWSQVKAQSKKNQKKLVKTES